MPVAYPDHRYLPVLWTVPAGTETTSMKRSFVVTIIALLLLGCALTCGASTSIGYLPYNSSAFDERTFDYKGHISYQIGGGGLVLNVITHDADSCGNGECYVLPSPHETTVCKITSGPGHMPYTHWFKVKILRDGTSVAGPEFVECYHFSMYEWYCYRANHFGGNHDGLGTPQWGFKQIICNEDTTEIEGNQVDLN